MMHDGAPGTLEYIGRKRGPILNKATRCCRVDLLVMKLGFLIPILLSLGEREEGDHTTLTTGIYFSN